VAILGGHPEVGAIIQINPGEHNSFKALERTENQHPDNGCTVVKQYVIGCFTDFVRPEYLVDIREQVGTISGGKVRSAIHELTVV
jgi:hypothetical protein